MIVAFGFGPSIAMHCSLDISSGPKMSCPIADFIKIVPSGRMSAVVELEFAKICKKPICEDCYRQCCHHEV